MPNKECPISNEDSGARTPIPWTLEIPCWLLDVSAEVEIARRHLGLVQGFPELWLVLRRHRMLICEIVRKRAR